MMGEVSRLHSEVPVFTATIVVEFGEEHYYISYRKYDIFGVLMETVYRWAADTELDFSYSHANDVMSVAMERMLFDIRNSEYPGSLLAFLIDDVVTD